MHKKITHFGSLNGRVFLISSFSCKNNWNGMIEDKMGNIDYELLEDFISYEEGNLTSFNKSDGCTFYIYFSMSSKIELFMLEDGLILCDGLYFNRSWDYSEELIFNRTDTTKVHFNVVEKEHYLFDAVLSGNSIPESLKRNKNEVLSFNLEEGNYSVYKVEVKIVFENQEITLKGIQLTR